MTRRRSNLTVVFCWVDAIWLRISPSEFSFSLDWIYWIKYTREENIRVSTFPDLAICMSIASVCFAFCGLTRARLLSRARADWSRIWPSMEFVMSSICCRFCWSWAPPFWSFKKYYLSRLAPEVGPFSVVESHQVQRRLTFFKLKLWNNSNWKTLIII